jgi:hypothetical protein
MMKLNRAKEVWIARGVGWLIALVLSCAIIFGTTFMLGPSLFAVPDLDRKIAAALYCPGAERTSLEQGASTPTTTSPTGTYGHTVEVTCFFTDGSTKTIRNEQYALASIGGMFGIGGLIGGIVSIPIMLLPLILIRKRKA